MIGFMINLKVAKICFEVITIKVIFFVVMNLVVVGVVVLGMKVGVMCSYNE